MNSSETEMMEEIEKIQDDLGQTITKLKAVEQQCELLVSSQETVNNRFEDSLEGFRRDRLTLTRDMNEFRKILHNLTVQIKLLVSLSDKIAVMARKQAKMEADITTLLDQVRLLQSAGILREISFTAGPDAL